MTQEFLQIPKLQCALGLPRAMQKQVQLPGGQLCFLHPRNVEEPESLLVAQLLSKNMSEETRIAFSSQPLYSQVAQHCPWCCHTG